MKLISTCQRVLSPVEVLNVLVFRRLRQFEVSILLHLDGCSVVSDGCGFLLCVYKDQLRNPDLMVLGGKETIKVHIVLQVFEPQS